MGNLHPPRFTDREMDALKGALRGKRDPVCISALRKLEGRKGYKTIGEIKVRNLQHFLDAYPNDQAKAVLAFMDANRWADPIAIARALTPTEFDKLADVTERTIEQLRRAGR